MLLSEIDIAKRLVDPDPLKRLVIAPIINAREQFGPSSFDVHVGTEFLILENINRPFIRLKREERVQESDIYSRKTVLLPNDSFFLHPGEFALASTLEHFFFPDDLAGRIEGRSSWGRLGLLVHATAGFVDPGFSGNLTFELFNAGRLPIRLKPGMRMAQLCFFELKDLPTAAYDERPESKYDKSLAAEGSRIWRDKNRS